MQSESKLKSVSTNSQFLTNQTKIRVPKKGFDVFSLMLSKNEVIILSIERNYFFNVNIEIHLINVFITAY